MTWIKIASPAEDMALAKALLEARKSSPREYEKASQESPRLPDAVKEESIIASHSLIPKALRHAFGTFNSLLDPSLPLTRRQHEMIAAAVSSINRCFY